MTLTLVSWRGINFEALGFIPNRSEHPAIVPAAVMLSVERSGLWGQPVGKQFPAQTYSFFLQYEIPLRSQAIRYMEQIFDPTDNSWSELVAVDENGYQWSLWCTTLSVVEKGLNTAIINVGVREPFWIRKTPNNTSWAITATGQQKQVTVNSAFARPKFTITPTSNKTGGLPYRRFIGIYNVMNNDWGSMPIDIMSAGWDSATLISGGKLQTNGYDLEVYVDGVRVSRWIGNVNTATSRIWINLVLPKYYAYKLSTSIAASGSITEIKVKSAALISGRKVINDLKKMPQAGILKIDSEYFTYTACEPGKYRFTGITRAAKLSSMALHNVDAAVISIPHDIWIAYGNTGATAPVQDATYAPVFNLNTSTNAQWNWTTSYSTIDSTGTGVWRPMVYKQTYGGTKFYADDKGGPPTDNYYYYMGMQIAAQYIQNGWKAETGSVGWMMFHPATIKWVECPASGMTRYRYTAYWPSAKLQVSNDGVRWKDAYTIGSPSYVNNWQVFSFPLVTLPFYGKYVRFLFTGTVPASANNVANLQANMTTLYFETSNMPNISSTSESGGYVIDATITLLETGETVQLYAQTNVNVAIVVDCQAHTVVRAEDNTPIDAAVYLWPPRAEWFRMQHNPPSNTCTFQWDEVGVNAVTVSIDTYEIQYAK